MAAGENRSAPELNEKAVIELMGCWLVGYEMIIANSAPCASLAAYHVISNARSSNNIQLSPEGEVNSGGYIPRREASRNISTALHRP